MNFWLGFSIGVFVTLAAWLIKEVVVSRRERGAVSPGEPVVIVRSPAAPPRPAGPRRPRVRKAVFSRERFIDGGR